MKSQELKVKFTEMKKEASSNDFDREFLRMSPQKIAKGIRRRTGADYQDKERQKWLLENADFLCHSLLQINARRICLSKEELFVLRKLISDKSFEGTREELFTLFELFGASFHPSEKKLGCIQDALILSLGFEVYSSAQNELEGIEHFCTLYHKISKIDFSSLVELFSPLEALFRRDPAEIYPKMTRDSQNEYRKALKREAAKKRISPEKLLERKLEKAKKENQPIGNLLKKERREKIYYPILFAIFAFLLCDFAFAFENFYLTALIAAPLWFFVKTLLDFSLSLLFPAHPILQMKVEKIEEENKTAVAITTLIASKEDVDEVCEKLNHLRINNKSKGDFLSFGAICDFPESKTESSPKDAELKAYLEKKINELNEKEACFFIFLRKRVYNEKEEKWGGRERKRGAIEDFIDFSLGEYRGKADCFGSYSCVSSLSYLIVLDSDTRMNINQVKRLVGMMIHPENRPVIIEKHGVRRVVSGYGIIQPVILSTLLDRISTPFGKIYANGSGEVQYENASFEPYQSLMGNGIFCGKGILDVKAYRSVLKGAFPEGKILSHDMPEGALLRCGLATNEHFSDSHPKTSESFYKRQHRWIRGDIQNFLIFRKLPNFNRFLLIENAFRYLLPFFKVLLLIVSGFFGRMEMLACALLVLLFQFQPFFITSSSILISGNIQLLGRHFSTKMRNLILNAFYQSLISVSSLLFEAYFYTDAIVRSVFRMTISQKNLLQWQVFDAKGKKKGSLKFFLPEMILAIGLLFIMRYWVLRAFDLLWLAFPFISLKISSSYKKKDKFSREEVQRLKKYLSDSLNFFLDNVGEDTNFLPPDNIQTEPHEKIAMRTSPTNIGLYFTSLFCGAEFGFISVREMCDRLERALDSLDRMATFHGHLFNWYDIKTLDVIGNRFVSTVDSGNFIASLISTYMALEEYRGKEKRVEILRSRIAEKIRGCDFSKLYLPSSGLMSIGIIPEEGKLYPPYDCYMSEARITSFIAIALGQVPASHWKKLSRPLLSFKGRVGCGSWSGTCFEYFMPPLFLDVIENSFEDESLEYAYFCQRKDRFRANDGSCVFGISESGYALQDEAGNYQYFAFGVPQLSLQAQQKRQSKVYAPYASFLMLYRNKKEIFDNLERFEKFGLYGKYGFYEALEFDPDFTEETKIVYSFMSHHIGMSILSIYNALTENKNTKRFLAFQDFAAKKELLAERFPIEGRVRKKTVFKEEKPEARKEKALKDIGLAELGANETCVLTDGKATLLADQGGMKQFYTFDKEKRTDAFDFKENPFKIRIFLDGDEVTPFAGAGKTKCLSKSGTEVEYHLFQGKVSVQLQFTLLSGMRSFLTSVQIHGFKGIVRIEIGFDAVIMNEREYSSHPAFHALSLEASADEKRFWINRRGISGSSGVLSVFSTKELECVLHGETIPSRFERLALCEPGVQLNSEFASSGNARAGFLFSLTESSKKLDPFELLDGELKPRKKILEMNHRISDHFNKICYNAAFNPKQERELTTAILKRRRILQGSVHQSVAPDELWKHGVSGDFPIITFYWKGEYENEAFTQAEELICAAKKLFLAGVRFDLIFLMPPEKGYFTPISEEMRKILEKTGAQFLLNKKTGIHFISLENPGLTQAFLDLSLAVFPMAGAEEIGEDHTTAVMRDFAVSEGQNTVGEFIPRGYEINKESFYPNVAFSYPVANSFIGFLCDQNSLGFTWFRNSGLNRLSRWNNFGKADDGEKVFLLLGGEKFDLIQMAKTVRFQEHYVLYEGELFGEEYKIMATLSSKLYSKLTFVHLSPKHREGELIFSFVPAFGKSCEKNILLEKREEFFLFAPSVKGEYEGGGFFATRNRSRGIKTSDSRLELHYEAGEDSIFLFGGFSNERHLNFIIKEFKAHDPESNLLKEKENFLSKIPEKLNEAEYRAYFQSYFCRFLARTGLYQSSGAYGFRDQLQDSLILIDSNPKAAREHLLRCASHQFEEGDVQHWWHPMRGKKELGDPGIRSNCSDDYLWLLFCSAVYLERTCDDSILRVKAPFLRGRTLKEGENEAYFVPEIASCAEFSEHLKACVRLFLSRGLSNRDLPPMLLNDWNDGMNRIGGESVWLGMFAAISLSKIVPFLKDENLNSEICAVLQRLYRGIQNSFNGLYFARAFDYRGIALGSDISGIEECSIDSLPQSFAALLYLSCEDSRQYISAEMVESALLSAKERLFDPKSRVIMLFTPPFADREPSAGYIQKYCAGIRENGGQYTHAAVWLALSFLEYGKKSGKEEFTEAAFELADSIAPEQNNSVENFQRYKREPYALCGDIYHAKRLVGHGGWSWYTGSAGWYYTLLRQISKEREEKAQKD